MWRYAFIFLYVTDPSLVLVCIGVPTRVTLSLSPSHTLPARVAPRAGFPTQMIWQVAVLEDQTEPICCVVHAQSTPRHCGGTLKPPHWAPSATLVIWDPVSIQRENPLMKTLQFQFSVFDTVFRDGYRQSYQCQIWEYMPRMLWKWFGKSYMNIYINENTVCVYVFFVRSMCLFNFTLTK